MKNRVTQKFLTSIVVFFMLSLIGTVQADVVYRFKIRSQETQFKHLLTEFRCVVCQNQNIADSNAHIAADLRAEIYNMVKEGKTELQIIEYLTERYGDFILYKPPFKKITLLLWFAPLIFVAIGLFLFWRRFRHTSSDE